MLTFGFCLAVKLPVNNQIFRAFLCADTERTARIFSKIHEKTGFDILEPPIERGGEMQYNDAVSLILAGRVSRKE